MSSTMSDVADVAGFGGLTRIEYFCQSLGLAASPTAMPEVERGPELVF